MPSKARINFTFWKVSLLEIHEVHLRQEVSFLVPPVTWTCSHQFPQIKIDRRSSAPTHHSHGTLSKIIIINSTVINIFGHKAFSKFPQVRIPEVILLRLKEIRFLRLSIFRYIVSIIKTTVRATGSTPRLFPHS